MNGLARLFLLCQALFVCACPEQPRHSDEAVLVLRAIDELREAPNSNKEALLIGLERLPCQAAEVCALKDQCALAYRTLVDTLAALSRLKSEVASAAPEQLVPSLQRAEANLLTAHERTAACARAEAQFQQAAAR